MTDWTAGYIADIDYTFGYYPELNPQRVKQALLNVGLISPRIVTACELGFGQGLSTNIHAAASNIEWYGTDFNPAHAGFAQELAQVSGAAAHLYDEAFAEFANRPDLPDFDYIGMHGIWSWISDENRAVIVDFVRRKLKVGGVLYVSYNTLPGWGPFAPMRHLMTEHARIMGTSGQGIASRIDGAIAFSEKLLAANPTYATANPQLASRLQKMKEFDRHYLAHEYFNKDWHPMHFSTMAEHLAPAKLDFACSAYCLDHVNAVNLSASQQKFLTDIPDVMFREAVRDFMVNQYFRRDFWIKGARTLSSIEKEEMLTEQQVMLIADPAEVSLKVTGSLGEASLREDVYQPILDALADNKPKTMGALAAAVKGQGIANAQIQEAMLILSSSGKIAMLQDETARTATNEISDKLNAHLMSKARGGNEIGYLASPLTGGGVGVGRFQQLFLLATRENIQEPAELAAFAWNILVSQGHKLLKQGKLLASEEENLAELTEQATVFKEKSWPMYKRLGIA
ncbi:MAG: class I SAM-dependent methyltransferase [Pseudomonadales bacterium]|nr:class I SAM-dependent methyltransferase [Pseudomonadales bacterium]